MCRGAWRVSSWRCPDVAMRFLSVHGIASGLSRRGVALPCLSCRAVL